MEVKELKLLDRLRDRNRILISENKELVKCLNGQESLIAALNRAGSRSGSAKIQKPKHTKGRGMTMELMLSDIHVGKKTDTFNLAICKRRMEKLVDVFMGQYDLYAKSFRIDGFILALIGDLIESQTMHEVESAKGCEFGNSRQIEEAINLLFDKVILPIASTGEKILIPCVTGNHDRTETYRTFHYPGEENITWIIYKMLERMAKAHKLHNVQFFIPKGPYQLIKIYNNVAMYEHGDNAKAKTEPALEALISKRQAQSSAVIDFLRVGHWHSYACYGRGRIIVNDAVPGADSYSQVLGFNSHAGQTLNFYIQTNERPSCFYSSFPIYLK